MLTGLIKCVSGANQERQLCVYPGFLLRFNSGSVALIMCSLDYPDCTVEPLVCRFSTVQCGDTCDSRCDEYDWLP